MAGLAVYEVNPSGSKVFKVVDVTFDSSYPTGGEIITPAQCGLSGIDVVIPEQSSGYLVQYVAGKLLVRRTTASHTHTTCAGDTYTKNEVSGSSTAAVASEVGNTDSLATFVVRLLVVGTL